MAAYSVGKTSEGAKVWWANWQLPGGLPGVTETRNATAEESALMEKVVWDKDTPTDLDKLQRLIQS